ncbi:hypothetical protein QJS10_CPB19g00170 [Acorus calamus]|uniref:Uncharacterized protein n=1 Tax=Acorus calamus TaxID=4465 RepID=A0AAV9CGK4_ACOCL|nr:hypothetical protein QJS10_CPB19g00170 [Acorus calamus]
MDVKVQAFVNVLLRATVSNTRSIEVKEGREEHVRMAAWGQWHMTASNTRIMGVKEGREIFGAPSPPMREEKCVHRWRSRLSGAALSFHGLSPPSAPLSVGGFERFGEPTGRGLAVVAAEGGVRVYDGDWYRWR